MSRVHLDALEDLDSTLDQLDADGIVDRLWTKDHTLWRPDPTEISDRLGWLDLVRDAPDGDPEIIEFVDDVRAAGLTDAVLLGMGGSSLGAEALRTSFGSQDGYLNLHVLDSTHPRWVESIRGAIDPAKTLFLVASKSGTTAEVRAFLDYFWAETQDAVGADHAGAHFAAITDPGTALVDLAEARGFRKVFVNPPDIGGRFSVLSRFGLVSAALLGIDIQRLMANAYGLGKACGPGTAAAENPGVWLGAVLGCAARAGRDQLTLYTSPQIDCFGLWAEQLIAESTGKEGKGILPVTGEPLAEVERYGDHRLFVALRLADDSAPELDAHLERLVAAGQPVLTYDLPDVYALGGELFRWQLATAVAGHLLDIQPFDQPNVQSAKSETTQLLTAWRDTGALPVVDAPGDLAGAIRQERPDFVVLMAYAREDEAFEEAVQGLRRQLIDAGITNTFGYGPRFLHSTGQLHKGGQDGGLFVQLMVDADADLAIAGRDDGFGVLLRAQAAGDLAALQNNGRRCVRIDLGTHPVPGLEALRIPTEASG